MSMPTPPADAGQVTISADELAALRQAAAERDQLAAAAAVADSGQPAEPDAPPAPTHRALLANGEVFEYSGAHPTEVHLEGAAEPVPVVGIYPIH